MKKEFNLLNIYPCTDKIGDLQRGGWSSFLFDTRIFLCVMIKKLDRFSEALQSRNPDAHIAGFFNDMYDEALANESYIAEMEWDVLSMMLRHQEYVKERCKVIRLKMGGYRTLKQIRKCRR